MTKSIFDSRVETTITAEKDTGFKRNSTDLWLKHGYFKQQPCNFSLEKARVFRPSGKTLGYLPVRGGERESFFDYRYNKQNSKMLCSTHKMKIPNSFSSTIFNRHRIQYEAGALSETDFSKLFFCLPSTTYRIEDINRYMDLVNLMPIDIKQSEFGENFDPSTLDYENKDREKKKRICSEGAQKKLLI